MTYSTLTVSYGACSEAGTKAINQDYYGFSNPKAPLLDYKGVAMVVADGISSSDVSQEASETAVTGFLSDYFSTSEAWSVKNSGKKIIRAINSWLYAQTRRSAFRYYPDKGYVCTFSALILKSNTAYVFHIGDSRLYRMTEAGIEKLTEDHRTWISQEKSYLTQALGMQETVEMDYREIPLERGDIFIQATDGVYEFVSHDKMHDTITTSENLNVAAKALVQEALRNGSDDNLTVQLLKVEALPMQSEDEMYQQLTAKPFPPKIQPRDQLDGYEILRELSITHRSYLYLAKSPETGERVVLKLPATEYHQDTAYLERFLMEEWIAKRVHSPHIVRLADSKHDKQYLYTVYEYLPGMTLEQWMRDHPKPSLSEVRSIIEQIAKGLRAFHRKEMLHQDIRPQNIMMDENGTVKIIDFGAVRVAGLAEITLPFERVELLGTAAYTAPEYFLGEVGSIRSDQFSLAVIAYQMLSGRLPYGTEVAKATTRAAQKRLHYRSVLDEERAIPSWVDGALRKALHPNPYKRYDELSEFVYDLSHPNSAFLQKQPIMERDPVMFWKSVSFGLLIVILLLLARDI